MVYSLIFSTITIFIIMFITLHTSFGDEYDNCNALVSCGDIHNVGYPFWGLGRSPYCGHPALQLHCPSNYAGSYPIVAINQQQSGLLQINGDYHDEQNVSYRVLSVRSSSSNYITIQLQELYLQSHSTCPIHLINVTSEGTNLFDYSTSSINLFYDCNNQQYMQDLNSFTCP